MSIFNKNLRFPIPLLTFERLSEIENKDEPVFEILEILTSVCNILEPTEDDVVYFLERHQEYTNPPKKEMEDTIEDDFRDRPQKQSRGTDFHAFISGLDKATALLMAVGHNIDLARKLYITEDFTIADCVIQTFIEMTTQTHTYLYESMIYAFGGSYPSDSNKQREEASSGENMSAADLSAMQHF
jgi:hypothetical protein